MNLDSIIFELSVILVGVAVLGTLFLYAKQPIIVAYIALGFAVGPNGFALIKRTDHIEEIAHFGVILLLFLIGLNLQPLKLGKLFRKIALLTLGTSLAFGIISAFFALLLGFDIHSALLLGSAMMFSSTVVGLKLVPTTALHHKRTGEVMTSVLLLQDVLAIIVILFVTGEKSDNVLATFAMLAGKFVLLCLLSFVGVRYVVMPLLRRFDVVQEYTFVTTLGWCLLWAEAAHTVGLSYELGAFVAGLSIASCQVALAIAEHLKPLREFFLILFFFAVGAELDLRLDLLLLVSAAAFGAVLRTIPRTGCAFGAVQRVFPAGRIRRHLRRRDVHRKSHGGTGRNDCDLHSLDLLGGNAVSHPHLGA
ncbi:MAG: cation:proton antiporter domain-containing protein [Planctomycetota bacterium]|jgi:Kef-type K+ transport system membrane component KefB